MKLEFEIKHAFTFNTVLHPIIFFAPIGLSFTPDPIRRTSREPVYAAGRV